MFDSEPHLLVLRMPLLVVALTACGAGSDSRARAQPEPALAAEAPAVVEVPAVVEAPVEASAPTPEADDGSHTPLAAKPPTPSPALAAAVDELFADYSGEGVPGAAVMVIRDARPILVKTYGDARIQPARPVEPTTNFRLASVTKQFTAMAILMLVDRNQLELDDSIRKHLPELPAFADDITIRHILQHTSGLRGYTSLVDDERTEQLHDRDVLELITHTQDTYFRPGSQYRYSNSGYAVLAVMIERISGQSFAEFLRVNIFVPLGMRDTVAYERGVSTVANRAFGYVVTEDGVTNSDQSLSSAILGDGGVYSSLHDLFLWDQALYGEALIPASLRREAFTPGLQHYGLGWRIDEYRGHRRVHHGGATCGFRNFLQRFPDQHFAVIVLTNRAGPEVRSLAEAVADLFLEPRTPVEPEP